MSVEQAIMQFCEPEKDDYVAKAAAVIRKKCLKDKMPWPTQPRDLEPEQFKILSKLNEFLTCLLTFKGMKSAAESLDSGIL